MAVESIFYSVSGISCRGALVWEEGVKASRPLLLMAPNWRGVIKPAIEAGQMLAGEGYVVFVADMFGEGNGPVGTENPMEFLRQFMSDVPGMRRAYSGAWAGLFNTHFWVDPASGVYGSIFSNFVPFGPPEALELYANFEPAVYASR